MRHGAEFRGEVPPVWVAPQDQCLQCRWAFCPPRRTSTALSLGLDPSRGHFSARQGVLSLLRHLPRFLMSKLLLLLKGIPPDPILGSVSSRSGITFPWALTPPAAISQRGKGYCPFYRSLGRSRVKRTDMLSSLYPLCQLSGCQEHLCSIKTVSAFVQL